MRPERWAEATLIERADHIGFAIATTHQTAPVAARLQLAFNSYRTRAEGQIALFLGDTRVGKTTLCEQFIKSYAVQNEAKYVSFKPELTKGNERDDLAGVTYVQATENGQAVKPIVMIQVGVRPTYKGLMRDTISH